MPRELPVRTTYNSHPSKVKIMLTTTQLEKLMSLIATTQEDNLDCDGCLSRVAEFADTQLNGRPPSEATKAVQQHLAACPCCADEYQALLDALQGM